MSRIGVFVCHCGLNIAKTVRVSELAQFAATLPGVVVAKDYKFMCSTPGQEMIANDIKQYNLDRVIVTACSPLMHEQTFRKVLAASGLNQYLLTIVNIREQVSWVTHDIEEGTAKAKALLNGAVYRARLLAPLTSRVIDVNPDVMVVGAGIAGIQAALELANTGKKVYLVEKNSTIGGHMAQFDKTFPTLDCSACILTPKMDSVLQHKNITMMTSCEVSEVKGYVGNFDITIKQKARYVDHDKCNACLACTEKMPREGNLRVGRRTGQAKGHLHSVSAGRAAEAGHRPGILHLFYQGQVQGLPESLRTEGHRLRAAGYLHHRESRGGGCCHGL